MSQDDDATDAAPLLPAPERAAPLTEVTVQLTGTDGNAFAILAKVRQALTRAGHRDLAARFLEEATADDYNHVLTTCCNFVHVR